MAQHLFFSMTHRLDIPIGPLGNNPKSKIEPLVYRCFRLPAGFVQLRNLTVLGLNDMSLTNLPSDFGR